MPVKNRSKNTAGRFRVAVHCPYCGSGCLTHKSQPQSPLTRLSRIACTNTDCGWTGVAVIETVKTVSPPSAKYWREGVLPVADKAYIEALPPKQDDWA